VLPQLAGENRIQKSDALSRAGRTINIWKRAERAVAGITTQKGDSSVLNVSVVFEKERWARLDHGHHDVKVAAALPPRAERLPLTMSIARIYFAAGFAAVVMSASGCWAMILPG
jgi:hypothetical protein